MLTQIAQLSQERLAVCGQIIEDYFAAAMALSQERLAVCGQIIEDYFAAAMAEAGAVMLMTLS